jgi:hypothetical protein
VGREGRCSEHLHAGRGRTGRDAPSSDEGGNQHAISEDAPVEMRLHLPRGQSEVSYRLAHECDGGALGTARV